MNIQVLMSTMKKKNVDDLKLKERNIFENVIIINQTDNEDTYFDEKNHIKMINSMDIGTSKSRNLAIKNADGDICLIADDDIIYVENYKEIIKKAFNDNPSADIITFQIKTPSGVLFKPKYMTKERWHNIRTSMKVASIEIAFRRKSIITNGLNLDLEFGLGSRYRIHDDVIFIADGLKRGLKIKYIPIPIVIHPPESSGTVYNDYMITSKGAAFYRIFGIWAILINIAFAIKKYSDYKLQCSFWKFIKEITKGSLEYKNTHKRKKIIKKEKKWI